MWALLSSSSLPRPSKLSAYQFNCAVNAWWSLHKMLGVRIRSVCLACISMNQHVWISRRGTCFWAGRSCMCNEQSVKSMRRKAKRTHYEFENVSAFSNRTGTRRYGRLSRLPLALFVLLGAAALFRTNCSRCGLHGVEAAFTLCLLLRFHTRLLALSSSLPSQLLPFWRRDNETASATTALRTINLHKCTQLFVNRMF